MTHLLVNLRLIYLTPQFGKRGWPVGQHCGTYKSKSNQPWSTCRWEILNCHRNHLVILKCIKPFPIGPKDVVCREGEPVGQPGPLLELHDRPPRAAVEVGAFNFWDHSRPVMFLGKFCCQCQKGRSCESAKNAGNPTPHLDPSSESYHIYRVTHPAVTKV